MSIRLCPKAGKHTYSGRVKLDHDFAETVQFEGGNRVPFLVRWPGELPAGRVCNKLLTNMDLLPTLAILTGARLPKKQIDGVDGLALLKGDDAAPPP